MFIDPGRNRSNKHQKNNRHSAITDNCAKDRDLDLGLQDNFNIEYDMTRTKHEALATLERLV